MRFVVLTGASGSGKTAIAEAIASRYAGLVEVFHFDRVGVPSLEEMIARHGSGEAWQRATTLEWVAKLAPMAGVARILLEGQMRPSFVAAAAAAAGITDHGLILVDCDDATRSRRLAIDRGRPDLATPTMMSWAAYLRDEARQLNCTVLDTTLSPLDACAKDVWAHLGP